MAKPPSWNVIRANAAAFVTRWADETQENAEAHSFWDEFLQVFGVDRKRIGRFEQAASRTSTGGRGRIDLFWPGTLVAEHKSAGKDLAKAEEQALDYLDSIDVDDFPGVVITSDFARMRILDLGGDNTPFEFPLTDLVEEIDRFGFIAGYSKRTFTSEVEEAANIKAAKLMGRLYEELAAAGYEGHEASILLTRLLFLLFGDDTGMWEKSLFTEFVETRTAADGSDLGSQLEYLFQMLNKRERPRTLDELIARFPYVNGGLFETRLDIPSFDRGMRDELLTCCAFDWGTISPAIFGSMFQAVKDKEARRELGEHYTTEENILKVISPLFLDGLRAELEQNWNSALKLKRMRARLGEYRYFDPACGCGNFLVVAYREMRNLELDIMKRLRDLTGETQLSLDATLGLQVSLDQFYGIEIEEWPARIAETAMFLVDHQANKALELEFGQAPERLPIEIAATIKIANAADMDWNAFLPPTETTFLFGNPPFHGAYLMSEDQSADRQRAFAAISSSGARTGRLDYVATWYAKAIQYLKGTQARAAFVSTNSITQGEQGRAMQTVFNQHGFIIDFAHRTFRWTSEAPNAAGVHVVVVGFSPGGIGGKKRLFDYPNITGHPTETSASNINFFLVDGPNEAPARYTQPLVPGVPTAVVGSKAADGGNLVVEPDDKAEIDADPIARKYLRRYVGATELLYDTPRWCLWLVDASPSDIRSSAVLKRRLKAVTAVREGSSNAGIRKQALTPGRFSHNAQPTSTYIALPQTSSENREYIPGAMLKPDVIATNGLIIWPDATLLLFGILQSSAFNAWVRAYTGRLESRIQIAPGTVCNNFPFILPTGAARDRVASAATGILDARKKHTKATLADLYDATSMPKNLRDAHTACDRAVDALYGLKGTPTESTRLHALLERYTELTAPLEAEAARPRKNRKAKT